MKMTQDVARDRFIIQRSGGSLQSDALFDRKSGKEASGLRWRGATREQRDIGGILRSVTCHLKQSGGQIITSLL